MTDPWIIFFFGLITGASIVLVIFQICLADLRRRIKRMMARELAELMHKSPTQLPFEK